MRPKQLAVGKNAPSPSIAVPANTLKPTSHHHYWRQPWPRHIFPVAVVVAAIVLAALKLSGSSVGMYHIMFNGLEVTDGGLLSGQPRSIRTDEWMVQTPWIASQARSGFAAENPYFLPSQNLTTMNVPVAHWVSVFRPALWPFFLLPLEQAFALGWWIHAALLLISSYGVLMWISRRNILASALGSMSLLWSPYLQWWYAGPAGLLDIASFAMLACLLACYAVRATGLWRRLAGALLFAYFAASFGLVLYPAGQIPVALLCGLVGIAAALKHLLPLGSRALVRSAVVIAGGALAVALVMLTFGLEFRELIRVIQETVYPGQRRMEIGGTIGLVRLLSGTYNAFLLRGVWPPSLGANQSEASSFFMLSLAAVPYLMFSVLRKWRTDERPDFIVLASLMALGILLAWMCIGLPRVVARLLLLELVPPARAWLAAGLANFLLIYYYLFRTDFATSPRFRTWAWLTAAGTFVAVWFEGLALMADEPEFLSSPAEVAVISAATALLVLLMLLRRTYAFSAVLLFFSLVSAGRVNPLYVGLKPLVGSEFAEAVQRISTQDEERATWMVYDLDLGNFLAANGARVLGGTWAYPNLEFWRQFDPEARYQDVYNRFSHVIFVRPGSGKEISFRVRSVDVIEVELDACHELLGRLGVKYYVFFEPIREPCLMPAEALSLPGATIHIYERVP